ncbi:MAG: cobyrinate a,c-diamide synthase [Veillonellales bacterium]
MNQISIPRLVIAGTHSGVGKTTIVTGLLAALRQRNLQIQSYKIGPDYIDPGYHRLASGKPAHNLDTWLVPEEKIVPLFTKTARGNDIALIEGVMGLYDGGRSGVSSTAAIAKLLQAPVVLVVDAKSMGESVAATVLGYKLYDPGIQFAGVIVNRLGSDTHREIVCDALQRQGIRVLGCLFRNDALMMPERHLGLTPVTEHAADETIAAMGRQISQQVDMKQLIDIARQAVWLPEPVPSRHNQLTPKVRIGVAQDDVFSFYYPESLEVLAALGAELVPFSPLSGRLIPPDVDGLILGGGFPEMFVQQLSQNQSMKESILQAYGNNMPILAECGGLMYLARQIIDFNGQAFDMVGAIPAVCKMEKKLQTVGYVEATALSDNLLCPGGDILRGHEFHFSRMIAEQAHDSWAFQIKKMRTGIVYPAGFVKKNLLASYLHLHFSGNEKAAKRLVEKCAHYRSVRLHQ